MNHLNEKEVTDFIVTDRHASIPESIYRVVPNGNLIIFISEMSASAWEHFLGTDWERYAKVATKATCIGCAGIGVITIMFNYGFLIGLWILWAALFLAILEFPGLFSFIPSMESYREFMMESLLLKLDEVKAIACFSFSLFCFMSSSITIFAGLALMATSILLAFSAVNRRVDAADQSAAGSGSSSHQHAGAFVNLNTPLSSLNINNMASKQNQYQPVQSNDMYINPHTGVPSQKQGVVIGSYQNA